MKSEIFNIEDLEGEFANFYHHQLNRVEDVLEYLTKYSKTPLPKVNPFYVDTRDLVAYTAPPDHHNCVNLAVSAAFPCIINFYFNNLMRTDSYLGNFYDFKQEHYRNFKDGFPIKLPNDFSVSESIVNVWNVSRPNGEEPDRACWQLTNLSMLFVFQHELAHIELGHSHSLDLLRANVLIEFLRSSRFNKTELQIRQVWEYEADLRATMRVLQYVLDKANTQFLISFFQFKDVYDVIGLASSAIFAVFHIFHECELGGKVHAPPLSRFAYIANFLTFECSNLVDGLDLDTVRVKTFDAAYNTYHSWGDLGLPLTHDLSRDDFWYNRFDAATQIENMRLKHCKKYALGAFDYPFPIPK